MKTTHIDGLPGLTLQGVKGPTGFRGNKIFYLTDAMTIENSTSKSCIKISNKTIEDLISGESNEYSTNSNDSSKLLDNLNLYLDDEAFNYDYVLYSADSFTYLYILTEDTTSVNETEHEFSDSESSESETSNEIKNLTAWFVDKWTLTSVDVSELPLAVEVENLNIDYIPWTGHYYSNKAECIPTGTSTSNNTIPGGHEFSILRDDELKTKIQSTVDELGVCNISSISGHVYSMEVDDKGNHIPLEGIRVALRTLEDVTYYGGREQYTQVQGEDSSCLTDNKGKFQITFDSDLNPEIPGYCVVLAYDENKMYMAGNFIVTGSTTVSDLEEMKLYLYDNAETQSKIYGKNYKPQYDIRKDDPSSESSPIFYVVDYFNYYDTSRCVSSYEDLRKAMIQSSAKSDDTSASSGNDEDSLFNSSITYESAVTASFPLTRFVVYSNLSSEEKSKIRIEAEFYKNTDIKLATMSTCKKDIWTFTDEERDEDYDYFTENLDSPYKPIYLGNGHDDSTHNCAMVPAASLPMGRCTGLDYKLNFDNEDLRDFKIVIKDYGEGIYVNKYVTFKFLPFDTSKYKMFLYLYYKNAPADISKTLLTT